MYTPFSDTSNCWKMLKHLQKCGLDREIYGKYVFSMLLRLMLQKSKCRNMSNQLSPFRNRETTLVNKPSLRRTSSKRTADSYGWPCWSGSMLIPKPVNFKSLASIHLSQEILKIEMVLRWLNIVQSTDLQTEPLRFPRLQYVMHPKKR